MSALKPEIGLVIRHAYLWQSEARQRREEGVKDRPCVIIDIRENGYQEIEVLMAPVTHTPPMNPERALEVPLATKQRLGLDDERSWVMTTEVNRFVWPGPDIRSVPGGGDAYGLLPAKMTTAILDKIRENARDKSISIVGRDDETLLAQRRAGRGKADPPKGKTLKKPSARKPDKDRNRER